MAHGVCTVGVVHRLLAGEATLEVTPLCTWRDQHGDRFAGADPDGRAEPDRASSSSPPTGWRGPDYQPGGAWYRGVHHREEAARGLGATEDLWAAGTFRAALAAGESLEVVATTELGSDAAGRRVDRRRRPGPVRRAGGRRPAPTDDVGRVLAVAADRFVVHDLERTDGGRRLPVVRRVVARPVHLVRGALPVHRPRRGGPGGAAARGRQRLGGHARQHRRRRDAGVQHDRRHAVVPARARPARRATPTTSTSRRSCRPRSSTSCPRTWPAPASASGSTPRPGCCAAEPTGGH